jgi:Lhr-like helicase
MSTAFHRLTGRQLYEWQQQVGEALLLGLSCTVIAPTGSGKTIPQILPLLASMPQGTFKMVLIISPLKDLQHEQVCAYIIITVFLYIDIFLQRQNVSGRWI